MLGVSLENLGEMVSLRSGADLVQKVLQSAQDGTLIATQAESDRGSVGMVPPESEVPTTNEGDVEDASKGDESDVSMQLVGEDEEEEVDELEDPQRVKIEKGKRPMREKASKEVVRGGKRVEFNSRC
jgi:hypothetical protein